MNSDRRSMKRAASSVQDRPESDEESADEAQVNEKEVVGTQNADSSPPVPKKSRANGHPKIAQRSVDGFGELQPGEASTGETSVFNDGPGNPAHISSNFNANATYPPLNPFHYPQPMMMPGYFHLPYMPYQYPYPYAAPPLPQHEMKNEADHNAHEQGSPRKSGKTLTASESSTPDTPRPTNQSTSNESFTFGWGSPAGNPPSFPYPPHPFNPMMRGGMMMYPPPAAFMFGAGHVPPSLGVPLSLQVDQERLSEYQIAIRKQLELFEASLEDVESNTQGRKKAVKAGQVGLRCRHCAMVPLRSRGRGAVYYPSTLLAVYQAAQNMASSHLCVSCQTIPPALKKELTRLRANKDNAGGGKQYWADACRAQGVVETADGLVFERLS